MNTFQKNVLALGLLCCALSAQAGNRIQYFVGYGLYPPDGPFSPDTSSTTPGTGLLAVNGSHRALIQLIWAGENNIKEGFDPFNVSGGFVDGDDVVFDSRIIEAGVDGVDEWGYTSSPPPPLVTTNSIPKFVFVRVHQDTTPSPDCHWYFDSPLVAPADMSSDIPNPASDALATVITLETGGETVPATGVALDQTQFPFGCPIEGPSWNPDPPDAPQIQYVEFNPATTGISFPIPYSYSFNAVYGADAVLPSGDWNWQLLEEGTHYTVTNGVVTLVTTGEGIPALQMIRLGLIHDF
jgi:hypothetical protein